MVNAKLYGYVNFKIKKDVAKKIQKICDENDIFISDLLLELVNDEQYITIKLKAVKRPVGGAFSRKISEPKPVFDV